MRSNSDHSRRASSQMKRPKDARKTIEPGVRETGRIWSLLFGYKYNVSEKLTDESGQTLVVVAMSLTLLMGAMALVVDVGFVRYQQRKLQTAADAAALAAGIELGNCSYTVCSNMKTAAEQALIEDGITTSTITPTTNSGTTSCTAPTPGSGLTLMINVAPCVLGASDPNYGNTSMVEVVLTQPQNMLFGAFVGMRSMNLVARAEAGDAYIPTAGGGNCLWAGQIKFNSSNGDFNLTNCGVYDNGNLQTNSGDGVTASSFLYYGTWSPNNCNSSCTWNLGGTNTGPPSATTTQQNDPLKNLTEPSQPSTTYSGSTSFSQSGTTSLTTNLSPGYYQNGFNINSPASGYQNIVNLSPGLYYFNGSVNVDAGATLECTTCTGGAGVTLFFENGSLQPNSSATITLNAAATGSTSNNDVANMLIWESKNNSTSMDLDANSTTTLNGVIYLPNAELDLNSGSGTSINGNATATAVDVNSLVVNSGVTLDLNGSQALLGGGGGKTLGQFGLSE